MAQLVEHSPMHRRVAGSVPGPNTYPSWGFDPQSGCMKEAADRCFSHIHVSLSLSAPSSLPLISVKKHIKICIYKNTYKYVYIHTYKTYIYTYIYHKYSIVHIPQKNIQLGWSAHLSSNTYALVNYIYTCKQLILHLFYMLYLYAWIATWYIMSILYKMNSN